MSCQDEELLRSLEVETDGGTICEWVFLGGIFCCVFLQAALTKN